MIARCYATRRWPFEAWHRRAFCFSAFASSTVTLRDHFYLSTTCKLHTHTVNPSLPSPCTCMYVNCRDRYCQQHVQCFVQRRHKRHGICNSHGARCRVWHEPGQQYGDGIIQRRDSPDTGASIVCAINRSCEHGAKRGRTIATGNQALVRTRTVNTLQFMRAIFSHIKL